MIGRLKGIVDTIGEDELILDVAGVGYLISAPSNTLSRLDVGEAATLQIETYVREDQFRLFGFISEADRAWFVRLQSVQGVGAKHALSILDAVGSSEVESAAALGDASAFERAKGVGKKLAQRIATELKDKAPPIGRNIAGQAALTRMVSSSPGGSSEAGESRYRNDAVSALINLGYAESAARQAVAAAIRTGGDDANEAVLIKLALKELT